MLESTLVGSLVMRGDSPWEFESNGFPSQIAVTKKLESNHHANKQKLVSHHQSIKW